MKVRYLRFSMSTSRQLCVRPSPIASRLDLITSATEFRSILLNLLNAKLLNFPWYCSLSPPRQFCDLKFPYFLPHSSSNSSIFNYRSCIYDMLFKAAPFPHALLSPCIHKLPFPTKYYTFLIICF